MGLPELTIVYPLDPLPDARFRAVLVPAAPQVSVIEAEHLWRQPGGHVTPLVMWPIGTVSSDLPGYRPVHIARETSPCKAETALARRDSLSAITVIQNSS